MESLRGIWRTLARTPDTPDMQQRIDRTLVTALMVGGVAMGTLGVLELAVTAMPDDFIQPIGGFGLALWAGYMLHQNRPRPVRLLALAMLLSVLFLVLAITDDASALEFAEPSTIAMIVITAIVAMSTTDQHRGMWMLWSGGVMVGALLIGVGIGATTTQTIFGALATGVAAGVGMYMVGVSRRLIATSEEEYAILADSTAMAVVEIDCTKAMRTLLDARVTFDDRERASTDHSLRSDIIDGIAVTRGTIGTLEVSGAATVTDAGDLLRRMLRSPRHDLLFERVIESMLTGQSAEYAMQASSTRHLLIKWTPHPMRTHVVTAITVDITGQKRAELALEEEIRSKDQFIASVSHELRTPLTAVLGLAEELRAEATPMDESERKELLNIIAVQTRDISSIVEDLLVVARAEIGEITISAGQIDLVAVAGQSIESVDFGARNDLPLSLPAFGDAARVRQILRNLLTNATRHGGPNIRVTGGGNNGSTHVEIRDDGPPLEATDQARIFGPYQRAHEPRRGTPDSVGLGLTVSRTLADLMGGSLTYGHDGTESIFRLTLPRTG